MTHQMGQGEKTALLAKWADIEQGYQRRIDNQKNVINRLMANGGSYDDAMQSLMDRIEELEAERVKRDHFAGEVVAESGSAPTLGKRAG